MVVNSNEFKNIFLPYHIKYYRIAYRILQNEDDSKDVLQELYLKLWTIRSELNTIKNHEAYGVTLLKNLCLNYLKTRQRRYFDDIESVKKIKDVSFYYEQDGVDSLVSLAKKLIETLPKNQKSVMQMRDINNYEMTDIAEEIGLSEVNVRVLLSRARKKIRMQLKKIKR